MFPDEFALYSSYPFDCITAGIHHCYNSVFPGAGNLSVSKAIHEYYQIMQKAIEFGGFQVMAHLDFPKLFFDKWIINNDVLDTILSTMINKNILLEVKIIDCLVDDKVTDLGEYVRFGKLESELKEETIKFAPDIVGISSIFSMFERDATEVATLVKSIDPNIIVVLGGVTATLPEIYEPLLKATSCYDVMVRGEGEVIFGEILSHYCKERHIIENIDHSNQLI